ncbi:MAG: hypothetical protein ACD_62C00161G0001 [uncultured bacterium]|nr:MAG: hypothetical protein ACD_62C00161G0001 [uncultured bacterium]
MIRNSPSHSAQCKRWSQDSGKANVINFPPGFFNRTHNHRPRHIEPDIFHGLTKQQTIFGLFYGRKPGTNEFNIVFFKNPSLIKRHGDVQGRLPTQCGKERVGPLFLNDLFNDLDSDGFNVSSVRQLWICHDGRGVGVDEHNTVPFFLEGLDPLRARIIKFTCLADDDRTRTDDEDGFYVSSFGHMNRGSTIVDRGSKPCTREYYHLSSHCHSCVGRNPFFQQLLMDPSLSALGLIPLCGTMD